MGSIIQLTEVARPTLFTEAEVSNKPKGVLKRVIGCIADWKPNRNGRVYPRELWEKAINSEYVQEMINNKIMMGELDHPEERVELEIKEISHCINKIWIDDQKEEVWGELDILDTPNGQIVSKLLDYGSKIGVSSRGAGSVLSDNTVDPDEYKLFTFDIVARPSVAAARPAIVEAEELMKNKKSLTESEVANILSSYRRLDEKVEETKNSFKYICESEERAFNTNVIERLKKLDAKINE